MDGPRPQAQAGSRGALPLSPHPQGIDLLCPADLEEVCRIHCALLPEGFLAQLGPAVLYEIYAGALTAPGVIGLVARHERTRGFLLATVDTRVLFRHVLLRRALPLGARLLGTICRHPGLLGRSLESARYPATLGGARDDPAYGAELIAIGVRPECRSLGYATAMVEALNREFRRRGVAAYTVAAYSSNEPAQTFYRKLGFEVLHEFRMYGAAWTRYRLRLGDDPPPSA